MIVNKWSLLKLNLVIFLYHLTISLVIKGGFKPDLKK